MVGEPARDWRRGEAERTTASEIPGSSGDPFMHGQGTASQPGLILEICEHTLHFFFSRSSTWRVCSPSAQLIGCCRERALCGWGIDWHGSYRNCLPKDQSRTGKIGGRAEVRPCCFFFWSLCRDIFCLLGDHLYYDRPVNPGDPRS